MPKKTVTVPAGVNLLAYLTRQGYALPAACDGKGICGRCRIRVTQGTLPVTQGDRNFLTPEALADGWRLACRAMTETPVCVLADVPEQLYDHARPETPHRYGLAVSGRSAAVVDLTAVTVKEIIRNVDDPAAVLRANYPGIVRTLTEKAPSDEEAVLEQLILILISHQAIEIA